MWLQIADALAQPDTTGPLYCSTNERVTLSFRVKSSRGSLTHLAFLTGSKGDYPVRATGEGAGSALVCTRDLGLMLIPQLLMSKDNAGAFESQNREMASAMERSERRSQREGEAYLFASV